jgi:hypothetical protein
MLLQLIDERELSKNPQFTQHYEPQVSLTGEKKPAYKTRQGIITMFKKAMVFGPPADIISYYLNKRGRRNKYGTFLGFVIAEIPAQYRAMVKPVTVYTEKDPGIEGRKAHKANLRKHKISIPTWLHKLEGNTLMDFATREAEINTWKKKNPDAWDAIRIKQIRERIDRRNAKRGEKK